MFISGINSSVFNNAGNETLELILPGLALVLFGIFLKPYFPKPVKGTPLYESIKGGLITIALLILLCIIGYNFWF
jgi:hypothetical protein